MTAKHKHASIPNLKKQFPHTALMSSNKGFLDLLAAYNDPSMWLAIGQLAGSFNGGKPFGITLSEVPSKSLKKASSDSITGRIRIHLAIGTGVTIEMWYNFEGHALSPKLTFSINGNITTRQSYLTEVLTSDAFATSIEPHPKTETSTKKKK